MIGRMTYGEAVAKAEHLIAVGETVVFLDDEAPDLPWPKAISVEAGGGYRSGGLVGCYVVVKEAGLTMKWSIDFEGRDANGSSTAQFDRARLRDVAMRLPPPARRAFADLLDERVMPALAKGTVSWRDGLQRQWDSEDCVRGLIAFMRNEGER